MKCTNCGHELPANAKFCTKCGIQVNNISTQIISTEEKLNIQDTNYNSSSNIDNNNINLSIPDDNNYDNVSTKSAFVWKEQYTYISTATALVLAVIIGLVIKIHKNAEIDNKQNTEIVERIMENNNDIEDNIIEDSDDYSENDDEVYRNNDVASDEKDNITSDIENQILTIREEYNDIVEKINSNSFYVKSFSSGANVYYSDDIIRAIIIPKNAYDNPYAQSFYYDTEENLIFAYYEANEANRLYFSDSKLIRWKYCEDAATPENTVEYDYKDNEKFNNLQNMIINDSNYYISLANNTNEELESNNDYIWPESDSRYMTAKDLKGFSKKDCWLARNELYARHGRTFDDEELQNYFNSKDWYNGTIAPDNFPENILNDYEVHNRDLIVSYEKKKGYR